MHDSDPRDDYTREFGGRDDYTRDYGRREEYGRRDRYEPRREEVYETVDGYDRSYRYGRLAVVVIRLVCALIAIALVLHVVLVLVGANTDVWLSGLAKGIANIASFGLEGLFNFGNGTGDAWRINWALGEGIAAVLWLLIGAALTGVIRSALTPAQSRIIRRRR